MSNEMLPADIFTRPRGWKSRLSIKQWLTDDDDISAEEINALGKKIANALRHEPLFQDDEVIANFEDVTDLDEFNSIMDDMYDECDSARILIQ